MAVNKVMYGSDVLIDLTSDTVTASTLAKGVTAHNKAGTKITGTMMSNNGSSSSSAWTPPDWLQLQMKALKTWYTSSYYYIAPAGITSVWFPGTDIVRSSMFSLCKDTLTYAAFENATSVQTATFADASKLISVSMENLTYISSNAFANCTSLSEIYFPNLTFVGPSGFYNCTNLQYADISEVKTIGSLAFKGCSNLSAVWCPNTDVIYSEAFMDCSKLTLIDLTSLSYLSAYAFANCSSLSYLDFTWTGFGIGSHAFENCTNLKNVFIGGNGGTLGSYTFANCTNLSTLECHVASIQANAFYSCNNLYYVDTPLLSRIVNYTFANIQTVLRDLYCNSANYVGPSAFVGFDKLQNIEVFNTSYIGTYAFSGCANLTELFLPKASRVASYAFYECAKLTYIGIGTSVVIPDEPSAIDYVSVSLSAFYGCSNLVQLELGGISVVYLAWFKSLSALLDLTLWVSSVPSLITATNLSNIPILDGNGVIYVPKSLISDFENHSEWASLSDHFGTF